VISEKYIVRLTDAERKFCAEVIDKLKGTGSPEGTLFETMRAFFAVVELTQPALAW
jgi:hypothetical protein